MLNFRQWSLALVAGATLALPSPTQAQFGPVGTNLNQAGYNPLAGRGLVPPGVGNALLNSNPYLTGYSPFGGYGSARLSSTAAVTSSYADPYGSYGGYGNPYVQIPDPYRGYFSGAADLTTAQGKYQIDYQQARLMNQQVEQSKIDTRRKLMEEWRYIRANMPTAEDVRLQSRDRELSRARKDPPLTDILSARALNNLLENLKDLHGKGSTGPDISLNADMMKNINVVSAHGGNIGLLKGKGELNWPLALVDKAFEKEREEFSSQLATALEGARANGQVSSATLKTLIADLRQLNTRLDIRVEALDPSEYIEAKRYLNFLDDALRALQDPNLSKYFLAVDDAYMPKGKTVGDLVAYMSKNGLRFSPAIPGNESAYRSLYHNLAAYDYGMSPIAKKQ